MFWVLMALNFIMPALEAAVLIPFNNQLLIQGRDPPSPFIDVSAAVVSDAIGLLQIISGVVAVRAIMKIRTFFKENKSIDSVDANIMVLHMAAFTIYLVATAAGYGTFTYYAISGSKEAF